MSGYHPTPMSAATSVQIVPPMALSSRARSRTSSSTSGASTSGRRLSAWIVRTIMLATTAFAVLDLSLLVSSVHH